MEWNAHIHKIIKKEQRNLICVLINKTILNQKPRFYIFVTLIVSKIICKLSN